MDSREGSFGAGLTRGRVLLDSTMHRIIRIPTHTPSPGENVNLINRLAVPAALLALLCSLTLPTTAEARSKPIQNVENAPIPDGLGMKAIGDAIIDGCSVRNWQASLVDEGHMQCTLYIRDHMAKVDIRFDTETFSITYADSDNLKYNAEKNKIHRNYNSWVQNLRGDINNALLKASR